MSKHSKRARKRGKVINSRECEALHNDAGVSWRQARGSHRHSKVTTWYEGEFSKGVAVVVTGALIAAGLLCYIFFICP